MATDTNPYEGSPSNPQPHLFPPPSYIIQHSSPSTLVNFNSSLASSPSGTKPLSQLGLNHSSPSSNGLMPNALHASIPSQNLNSKFSGLSSISNWVADTKNFRIQGWDPILIIAQIVALQALHYLTLSIVVPPLLSLFAKSTPLEYEGGPANVAMIMDWREMVGYGTLHRSSANKLGGWAGFGRLPDALGRRPLRIGATQPASRIESGLGNRAVGLVDRVELGLGEEWGKYLHDAMNVDIAADTNRGWVLAGAWLMASLIGVWFQYHIVRRPIHIMDHSLTICLNHLILTTYYSSSFPTSLWFYSVLLVSAILQTVWAENLCVKREMREGLGVGWKIDQRPEDLPSASSAPSHLHNSNNTLANNGSLHPLGNNNVLNDER